MRSVHADTTLTVAGQDDLARQFSREAKARGNDPKAGQMAGNNTAMIVPDYAPQAPAALPTHLIPA
jgi:hypothetical protein